MCFVGECCTGFLVIQISLVSSYLIGITLRLTVRSKSYCAIHKILEQHAQAAIYLASTVNKATEFFFLKYHEFNDDPKN